MSHQRCCCGGEFVCVNTSEPEDWPDCVQVDVIGVAGISCVGVDPVNDHELIAFSGINRTFTVGRPLPGMINSYGEDFPCYVAFKIIDQFDNEYITWYNTVHVSVVLACVDDETRVSEINITLSGGTTVPSQSSPWELLAFFYDDFTSSALPVGFGISNELTQSCSRSHNYNLGLAGGGDATVTIPSDCEPEPYLVEAYECDGDGIIIVDLDDYPADDTVPYLPTLEVEEVEIVYVPGETKVLGPKTPGVVWLERECGIEPDTYQLARNCNNHLDTISYDPSAYTGSMRTLLWDLKRYVPTTATTTITPVAAVQSNKDCFGVTDGPIGICSGLVLNDPRCSNPIFDECPQCNNFFAPPEEEGAPLMGTGRFGSDAMLDAMGHNPDTESAKSKQGGCCGQPSKL